MRRCSFVFLLVASFLLIALGVASAQDAPVAAELEAQDAEASIEEALAIVEAHPDDPAAAHVLGLRYAHAGQIGLATLYLERSHLLAPLQRETGDALHTVRREARRRRAESMPSQIIMEGEPPGVFWWRFFHVFSMRVYAMGVLLSLWAFFGLLALWRRMDATGRRDAVLVVALGIAFIGVNAGVFWAGATWTTNNHEPAVVVASSPRFVDAPDEISRSRRQANLYEGAIAVIIEDRDDWRLLQLVDGEEVWVRANVARSVLP